MRKQIPQFDLKSPATGRSITPQGNRSSAAFLTMIPSSLLNSPLMADPRTESDFQPDLLPQVEIVNRPAADEPDVYASARQCYVAIYYRLNQIYRRLAALRRASPKRRAALAALTAAQDMRDGLEDATVPFGIFAEPVLAGDGVTAMSLRFTTPPGRWNEPSISSFSHYVKAPRQPGIRQEGKSRTIAVDELRQLLETLPDTPAGRRGRAPSRADDAKSHS
jgi:hypothetical protein